MTNFKCLMLFLLILSLDSLFAQEVENDQSIEEIVVTGSYLKTSPTDGASPIDVIDREAIENFGANTVADLVRNLASNSGSENVPDSFTSGATQGTSNINLRGLGLSSTLVLIDGRRQTVAGATANDGSVFVNTSIIPLIAVERVEVLKEGAASVYGSDAVAGVVNYIFRRDFTGIEVSYNHQFTDIGSQEDDRVSLIFGEKFGNTNIVIAADFLERSPMSSALRPESTQLGISGLGNSFLLFGPSTVEAGPYAGTYAPFTNVPDANCVENNGFLIPQASGSRCGFLYGPRFNIVNDEEHQNVYGSIKSDLSNGMEFNADVLFSSIKVNDNPQSPSYPALSYLSPSKAILPGQAGNPFGVPLLWLGRPLGSAFPSPNAPRDIDNLRFSVGLTGNLGRFDWDLRYTHSETDHYFFQPDTSTSRFSAAIAGQGGTSGTESWNLFDPTANSSSLREWISTAQETWSENELDVLDLVFSGEIGSTSAGNIDIAFGLQYREEAFDLKRDKGSIVEFDSEGNLVKPADLLFLGGGSESSASRDAIAFFAEVSVPVTDKFQVNGAVRYEELEDDSTFDPKVSLRYEVSDSLILRASASTSFREASLSQLYSSGVGLQGIQDFNTDGTPRGGTTFIRIAQDGNANLSPEESDNLNIGAIWRPQSNLELKLDYWSIDYSDVITIESAQGIVAATPLAPAVKRTIDGTLIGVTTKYFNASNVKTDGIDFEINYSLDTSFGDIEVGLSGTHMNKYEIPNAKGETQDVVGLFNHDNFARSLPETKMTLSAVLNSGPHKLALYGKHISDYKTTRALSDTAKSRGYSQKIDEWFSVDLQYNYIFDIDDNQIRLTLGGINILDEDPPLVFDAANFSYDSRQHDARGRIMYIGVKLIR